MVELFLLFCPIQTTEPSSPKLFEILNVLDLLAVCAEGGKRQAEDVGQRFFSEEDLIG